MSSRLYAMVWSRYPNGGGEMLLALCLADQACDDGTYVAPNVLHLAKKTRQTQASVERQLLAMVSSGWLVPMAAGAPLFQIAPAWVGGSDLPDSAKNDRRAEASHLPDDWALPKSWGEWALKTYPAWTSEFVREVAQRFRNHWISAGGQNARKRNWEATWQNWCMKEPAVPKGATGATGDAGGEWWKSASAIEKKGTELGLALGDGELFPTFRDRVFCAAGDGPWMALVYRGNTTNHGLQRAGNVAGIQQGA